MSEPRVPGAPDLPEGVPEAIAASQLETIAMIREALRVRTSASGEWYEFFDALGELLGGPKVVLDMIEPPPEKPKRKRKPKGDG